GWDRTPPPGRASECHSPARRSPSAAPRTTEDPRSCWWQRNRSSALNREKRACIAPHLPGIQMSPRPKERKPKKPAKARAARKARGERPGEARDGAEEQPAQKAEAPLEPEVLEPEAFAEPTDDEVTPAETNLPVPVEREL